MTYLSRRARPLLRTVGNKPHASHDDHETQLGSRHSSPLSDVPQDADPEDYTRDPDSASSSEDEVRANGPAQTKNIHSASTFTSGAKRKAKEPDSSGQPEWVVSSQQSKRPKTAAKYGSSSQRSSNDRFKRPAHDWQSTKPKAAGQTFKQPGIVEAKSSQSDSRSSQNSFLRPSAAADLAQLATTKHVSTYEITSSPPEVRTPSPEVEEVYLDGVNPADYEPCQICGQSVAKDYKNDWQIQYCNGKRMSLKMQERFCLAHKLETAASTWSERGYPEVDWQNLSGRLIILKPQIEDILDGKTHSSFRDRFEAKVKQSDSRTVAKAYESGSLELNAGYYGGRGARIMADFCTAQFNNKLLRLALKDKLVATSSVAGGISGFVNCVVVPELALALIMEDMNTTEEKAKQVLDESTLLGNTLHPEQEDHVPERRAPESILAI